VGLGEDVSLQKIAMYFLANAEVEILLSLKKFFLIA